MLDRRNLFAPRSVQHILETAAGANNVTISALVDPEQGSEELQYARETAAVLLADKGLCPMLRNERIQDILPIGMGVVQRAVKRMERDKAFTARVQQLRTR